MVDDVTKAEQERSHGKVMMEIGELRDQLFSFYTYSPLGINSLWEMVSCFDWHSYDSHFPVLTGSTISQQISWMWMTLGSILNAISKPQHCSWDGDQRMLNWETFYSVHDQYFSEINRRTVKGERSPRSTGWLTVTQEPGTQKDRKEKQVESRYNIDSDNKKKRLWNGQKKRRKSQDLRVCGQVTWKDNPNLLWWRIYSLSYKWS